jgi:uncharacterized protein (UPF0332 family)
MSEIEALLAKAEKYLQSADLLLKAGDYDSPHNIPCWELKDART